MYKVAFKNLWLRKTRTLLALVGLSIAVIGIIGLISISEGIKYNVTSLLNNIDGVTVLQKGVIDDSFSAISLDYVKKIQSIQGVKVAAPLVIGVASNVEKGGGKIEAAPMGGMIMLIGVDPEKNLKLKEGSLYNPRVKIGRALKSNDKHAVIIGSAVADKYNKNVGNNIFFNGLKFKIVGIFESGSIIADKSIAAPLEVTQEMLGKDKNTISSIYVETKNPKDVDKIASLINMMYGDELEAKTATGYSEQMNSIMSNLDIFFLLISSIALIVGAIGILNTMLMSVMERTKEIGILKAVGWTSEDVMKLIITESSFLGVLGGLIGCAVAFVSINALKPFIPFNPIITLQLIVSAFMLSIILGVLGGVYPAWKAAKLDPVQAIRYE